jgi:Spy/CpxP family protein refolding chaperone
MTTGGEEASRRQLPDQVRWTRIETQEFSIPKKAFGSYTDGNEETSGAKGGARQGGNALEERHMRLITVLAAAVLAGCLASGVYAQENALRPSTLPGASGANTAHGWSATGANVAPGVIGLQSSGAFSRYGQMIKICGLSEEQQNEIKEIEAERNKITQAHYAENADKLKEAQAALSEAYKSKDKDAIQKAMADYRDLMEPVGEFQKSAHAKIMGVLTAEQKAVWQEYQVFNNIKAMFYRANLTEEQLAQLKAAYADLAKDKDAKVEDLVRKLNEQARGLLTDEQKETMKAPMRFGGGMLAPGAPINAAPNPAPGQPLGGQSLNNGWAPGASAGGAVIMIGEGGNGAGSYQGTVVQEGPGAKVHVIQSPNGAVGTVTIRVEEADK